MIRRKRNSGRLMAGMLGSIAVLLVCGTLIGALMAQDLKQSTGVRVVVGPFLVSADGIGTYATAIPATLVWVSKNGAAPVTKSQADATVHLGQGFHAASFDGTDTDTRGTVTYWIKVAGKFVAWKTDNIVTANWWDSKYSTDRLQVDLAQIQGTAPTTASAGKLAVSATSANVTAIQGTAPSTASAGVINVVANSVTAAVTVGTNNDKTGYTLTNLSDANAGKLEDILDGTGGTGLTLNSLVINGTAAGGVVDIDNAGGPGIKVNGTTYGIDCRASAGTGIYALGAGVGTFGLYAGGDGGGISAAALAAGGTGLSCVGNGAGDGIAVAAGATGIGIDVDATAGSAVDFTTAAGSAFLLSGTTFGINVDASAGDGIQVVGSVVDIDADISGNLSGSVGSLTTWDKTGYSIADATSDAVIADAVWNALVASYGTANTYGALVETNLDAVLSARTLAAADYFLFGTDAVANVTLVATTTTNTDMVGTNNAALAATALSDAVWTNAKAGFLTGDAYVRLGAPAGASIAADIAAIAAGDATAANQVTLLARLTAARAGYLDELAAANMPADLDAVLTDTGTTLPARFTGIEGAGFLTATDSLEAIRNRGDAAWITGAGGTGWTAAEKTQIRKALGLTGTTAATSGDGIIDDIFKVVQGGR